ncbi:MAG: hemerythrin domain-containing protein [Nitrosomonadales bacterium]|nr:hemerythrin domain-containing protein [Nitrosomonadales bacterium]
MLHACHDRIQAQCDTLLRLAAHLRLNGNDAQASQAARAILRYFDTAGRHHHQDEERDLLPLLLATSDPSTPALIARLLAEHQQMDAAWQRLRPLLTDIAEDRADRLDEESATHFAGLYAKHIALENGELLPLAARLLDPQQLERLGRNMAERRGVSFADA